VAKGFVVRPKVAFVGFGEVNTPKEIIRQKCDQARQWLASAGLDVVSTASVSDDPEGKTVERAVSELTATDFDLLIACVAGWIPSQTVVRVVSGFRHLPILLWGLSGCTHGGRLITTADQAGTTALRQSMEDLGFTFKYIPNFQDAAPRLDEIGNFARAASAAKQLHNSRIGMMGYRDMKLYATLHDGISLRRQLGVEIESFEMLEMVQRSEAVDAPAVASVLATIRAKWSFEKTVTDEVLEQGIRYYLAVRDIVTERGFQGVSLTDVDGMKKLLHFPPAMVFMLLADELAICTIPENDSLGAVTQLITRQLTGQIGAYLEFYEFFTNGFLMGVPDYVPSEIVDGPVRVAPTSFGNLPGGLLNVSRLKTGKATLCRLARRDNRYVMHVAVGDAIAPRAWEEAGWTPPAPQLPGLEFVLRGNMEKFSQNVMGQHYVLSYGENSGLFMEFCKLTGIEAIG
jgi:L-arabinose isomerase